MFEQGGHANQSKYSFNQNVLFTTHSNLDFMEILIFMSCYYAELDGVEDDIHIWDAAVNTTWPIHSSGDIKW